MEDEHHDYDGVYDADFRCIVCRRNFQPENETDEAFDALCMCRDCKSVVFGDLEADSSSRDVRERRPRGVRARQQSAESVEDVFLREFSHLISLARHNRRAQSASSSVRWRRPFSDTESDGLDQIDPFFGENDSSFSFGGYGGESDTSADGPASSLDRGIDPMHTGFDPWSSENQGEEHGGETLRSAGESAFGSSPRALWATVQEDGFEEDSDDWEEEAATPEPDRHARHVSRGAGESMAPEDGLLQFPSLFSDLEEYDHLNGRSLEELLEHLAEMDDPSRRGAPPASSSFVENLPRSIFSEEKNGQITCAICKDPLLPGAKAIQLPCLHFYHSDCILPWLSARNSCPLCRHELPTDDPDYERGKWRHLAETQMESSGIRVAAEEEEEEVAEEEEEEVLSSSRGSGGGGWILLAAAPIVGIVGAALVLWLGKPLSGGGRGGWSGRVQRASSSSSPGEAAPAGGAGRGRRWWLLF